MQMTAAFDAPLRQTFGREQDSKKFLRQDIAARDFLRRFRLAGGIEVIAAALENGLRRINLRHPAVEPSVKVVKIMTGGQ